MSLVIDLSLVLHLEEEEIIDFLHNAPQKYKVYRIPKRTYGYRVIAHPAKKLKEYQYAFLALFDLPYHPCAMAYIKKTSIKQNALQHKDNSYLLKMDFSNFFNSITPEIFWSMIKRIFIFKDKLLDASHVESISRLSQIYNSERERKLLENILFWSKSRRINEHLMLSVGAPTSPVVSNMIMYIFDTILFEYCMNKKVVYTRYADDIFFSTKEKGVLSDIPDFVNSVLFDTYLGKITVNSNKTVMTSKKHNRFITGITITNDGNLSLGRKNKRYIKHLVHQFVLNILSKEDILYLHGLLAHGIYIDPKLKTCLEMKYGDKILHLIKASVYRD